MCTCYTNLTCVALSHHPPYFRQSQNHTSYGCLLRYFTITNIAFKIPLKAELRPTSKSLVILTVFLSPITIIYEEHGFKQFL